MTAPPADLLAALLTADLDPGELADLVGALPPEQVTTLLGALGQQDEAHLPESPADQARALDPTYVLRDHLTYLSERLAVAMADVAAGTSRFLVISMPPRSGKSTMTSIFLPVWCLRRDPTTRIGLISHDPTLAVNWGRSVRGIVEAHGPDLGLAIAPDAGAAAEWQTTQRGGILARSAPGQSVTGRGFKVLLIDDVVKDFAAAHSAAARKAVWDWWLNNALTRLEPPSLVVVIGTRWHEDDFIGRLLSSEYEGDPADWEVISFPALAETDDVLGRTPGEPLYSPLLTETPEQATQRWNTTRRQVGEYAWSALYQQRPSPAKGAIIDLDALRYWSRDPAYPALASANPATDTTVYLDPSNPDQMAGAVWLDSWDLGLTGEDGSDYTVGQRWARIGPDRVLIAQSRARRTFTDTIAQMKIWADPRHPLTPIGSRSTHRRVVEKAANGHAAIDTLTRDMSGIIPVKPVDSKEMRVRAITPEVDSRHVLLPHPGDPGNGWVADLITELREFPNGRHDDQADCLSQALLYLRTGTGLGSVTVPDQAAPTPTPQGRAAAARTDRRRLPSIAGTSRTAAPLPASVMARLPGHTRR